MLYIYDKKYILMDNSGICILLRNGFNFNPHLANGSVPEGVWPSSIE